MKSFKDIAISNADYAKMEKLVDDFRPPYVFSDKKCSKKLINNGVVMPIQLPLMDNVVFILTGDFIEYLENMRDFRKL